MYRQSATSVFLAAAAFQPSVEAQMRSAPPANFPTGTIVSPWPAYHIRGAGLLILRCLLAATLYQLHFAHQYNCWRQSVRAEVNGSDFRHDSSVRWNGFLCAQRRSLVVTN